MYRDYNSRVEIGELVGKTFESVVHNTPAGANDELVFTDVNGDRYVMTHQQDCCESVGLYETYGDLKDLVGSPILRAEAPSSTDEPYPRERTYDDSFTWTFYRIATIRGSVTLRWLGESNGYYSESVYIYKESAVRV